MNQAADFDDIRAGMSTAEDVGKIAHTFEINSTTSMISSVSLLEDGKVYLVRYVSDSAPRSRKDLIVDQTSIMEIKEGMGYLTNIYIDVLSKQE